MRSIAWIPRGRMCFPGVGRLYRAAMEAPVLANEIMAGTHPVFLDQEYGRSGAVYPETLFEVKVDPDIPECLKDASDCVEILCQEEDRLHIRSCLLHPDFPVLPENSRKITRSGGW